MPLVVALLVATKVSRPANTISYMCICIIMDI